MDEMSFQELIFYPRLLLSIVFMETLHLSVKPYSIYMYNAVYLKIMCIQNDSQCLIHQYWVPEKKYSMDAFLKTLKANQSFIAIFQFYVIKLNF